VLNELLNLLLSYCPELRLPVADRKAFEHFHAVFHERYLLDPYQWVLVLCYNDLK